MDELDAYRQLLAMTVIDGVTVSADGTCLAFTTDAVVADPGGARLHLGRPEPGGTSVVASPGHHALPVFAPDPSRLAYGWAADAASALRPVIRDADGTTSDLRCPDGAVETIVWSPDAASVLVLLAEPGSEIAGAAGGTRVPGHESSDPRVYRPRQAWRRVYELFCDSRPAVPRSPAGLTVWEFAAAADGRLFGIVSTDPSEDGWYAPQLAELTSDDHRVLYRPSWQVQSLNVSSDGRRLAFVEGYSSDRGQGCGEPTVLDLASGRTVVPVADLDAQRVRFLPDGRLFHVGQDGLHTACGFIAGDPFGAVEQQELWNGAASIGAPYRQTAAISDDGRIVVASLEAPGRPPEVCALRPDPVDRQTATGHDVADWRPLTEFNAALRAAARDGRIPAVEEHEWPVGRSHSVQGLVLHPPAPAPADPDRPRSLVVYLHGGPNNAWTSCFAPGHAALGTALALAGHVVLFPNFRGSTGRGQAFTRSTIGNYGRGELDDIVAGIADLAGRSVIDPERVGVIGNSAGGYLSALAATLTSRTFAAAVPMACVSNWLSFQYTSNIPSLTVIEFGVTAQDDPSLYLDASPVMHATGSTTATLVLHGELDLCTPLGQAQELYHALTTVGSAAAELVVYPREGHNLREREHLEDRWHRVRAWFAEHLSWRRA